MFPEASVSDLGSTSFKILYTFLRKKAYLAVPSAGVGVAFNPEAFYETDASFGRRLSSSLFFAYTYGSDDSHDLFLHLKSVSIL